MRNVMTLGLATLALAACSQPKQLAAEGSWVRLGAVPGRPAAAYFVLQGGPAAARLISVTTDVAVTSEMHETIMNGSMASMKPVTAIDIPANGRIEFKPGGRHVMLFDMNPGIKPGAAILLTFSFADGLRIQQKAGVVGAGDPEPK